MSRRPRLRMKVRQARPKSPTSRPNRRVPASTAETPSGSTASCDGSRGPAMCSSRRRATSVASKIPSLRIARGQLFLAQRSQLMAEPSAQRDSEALLRPVDDRIGQLAPHDLLQDLLPPEPFRLYESGRELIARPHSTSRNGACTSSEVYMLARSTLNRMSSRRYVRRNVKITSFNPRSAHVDTARGRRPAPVRASPEASPECLPPRVGSSATA